MEHLKEAGRCLKCKKARYSENCLVLTDIPEVMRLYEEGKLDEAGEILFNNNPLSLVCAIVCPHERNCAGHCVRGLKGEPIHWYEIEKEISWRYLENLKVVIPESNGHRVAVIGAGPSGITLSLILARKGYSVTLIDNHDKIGGIMRYGIPEFRLSKHYLDRYYQILCDIGQGPQAAAIQGTNIERTAQGLYQTDENGKTQKSGVFAADDVVTSPKTVVEVIAFTKKVAEAIDGYCRSLDK